MFNRWCFLALLAVGAAFHAPASAQTEHFWGWKDDNSNGIDGLTVAPEWFPGQDPPRVGIGQNMHFAFSIDADTSRFQKGISQVIRIFITDEDLSSGEGATEVTAVAFYADRPRTYTTVDGYYAGEDDDWFIQIIPGEISIYAPYDGTWADSSEHIRAMTIDVAASAAGNYNMAVWHLIALEDDNNSTFWEGDYRWQVGGGSPPPPPPDYNLLAEIDADKSDSTNQDRVLLYVGDEPEEAHLTLSPRPEELPVTPTIKLSRTGDPCARLLSADGDALVMAEDQAEINLPSQDFEYDGLRTLLVEGVTPGTAVYELSYSTPDGQKSTSELIVEVLEREVELQLTVHNPGVRGGGAVDDDREVSIGAVTFVNLDNDDADNDFDHADSQVLGGDNELVKVSVRVEPVLDKYRKISLSGGGQKAWLSNDKAGGEYVFGDELDLREQGDALVGEIWVEGVTASSSPRSVRVSASIDDGADGTVSDEVAITVVGIARVQWYGIGNGLNPSSPADEALDDDPNWNVTPGKTAKRVFPGARAVNGIVEPLARDSVYCEVTLTTTVPEDISVYLRPIDVDDPSSDTQPVDDPGGTAGETVDQDNRGEVGGSKAGHFEGAGANGVTEVHIPSGDIQARRKFTVSLHPGDNYVAVAGTDKQYLGRVGNPDSVLAKSAGANANYDKQRIIDPVLVAPSLADREVREADSHTSPALTVWRILHMELDSMEAVRDNDDQGLMYVLRRNTGIARVNHSLDDGSPHLGGVGPARNNGRFENGTFELGLLLRFAGRLDGNSDNEVYAQASGAFDVPYTATTPGGLAVSGKVVGFMPWGGGGGGGSIVRIDRRLPNSLFEGGTITIAGNTVGIRGSFLRLVVTSSPVQVDYLLHDDDDDALLPQTPPVTGPFRDVYRTAYIETVVDGGNSPANNQKNVPFAPNSEATALYQEAMRPGGYFQSHTKRRDDFWIGYVLMAFQGHPEPRQENGVWKSDLDPNTETRTTFYGFATGRNDKYDFSVLFVELAREHGYLPLLEHFGAHEVGHQFGLNDGSGGMMSYDFMQDVPNRFRLFEDHKDWIRSNVTGPGRTTLNQP